MFDRGRDRRAPTIRNTGVPNPLGAKGVGELGIVGLASAISNAIFDATGKRLTKLPMLLDDVLEV